MGKIVKKEFTLYGVTYKKGDEVKLSNSLLEKYKEFLEDAKPNKKDTSKRSDKK